MKKVVWTEPAIQQLRGIHEYIAASSEGYAQIVVQSILDRSEQIEMFPYSGRVVPMAGIEELREVLAGKYRLYYLIKSERIEIVAVFHTAQQSPWQKE